MLLKAPPIRFFVCALLVLAGMSMSAFGQAMHKPVVSDLGADASPEGHAGTEDTLRLFGFPLQALEMAEVAVDAGPTAGTTLQKLDRLEVRELDFQPAVSRIAALEALPAVNMHMAGGGMIRPIIRGLSGLRVGTIFHHAMVESQAWGDRNGIFVPEEGLERVEVIRGPGAMALVPGALGGVIRFVPLSPGTEEGRFTRFSTALHSNTGGYQASGMTRKRSASAYHTFVGGVNRFGRLTTPDGQAIAGTQYGQFYAQGRYGYLRPWGRVEGAYTSSYNTAGILGTEEARSQSGDHLLTSRAFVPLGTGSLQAGLSYQLNHRVESAASAALVDPPALDTLLDQSLRNTRFDLRFDPSPSKRGLHSAWGAQFAHRTNTGERAEPNDNLLPNAQAFDAGGFFLQGWSSERFSAEGLLRGDRRQLSTNERDGKTFLVGSAALGVQWTAAESLNLHVHAARSGRAPSMGELWSQGLNRGSAREEWGEADLETEVGKNLEISADWSRESLSLEIVAHHNNLKNFIFWQPIGTGASGLPAFLRSQADAVIRGVDVTAAWSGNNGMWAQLAGALMDGQMADGTSIPLFPPSNVRATLGWASEDDRARACIVATHSEEATLLNLSAEGNLGEHLGLGLSFTNLLDASYITVLSDLQNLGLPEAGRNIRLRLTWSI